MFGGNTIDVMAYNDNIPFKFTMKSEGEKSRYSKGRYRQTTDPNNQWKVKLRSSEEGKGTVAKFYLTGYDYSIVSKTLSVKQGRGAHYQTAYSSASKRTVYLTVTNNNWSTLSYVISGYWDEETR